MLNGQRIGVFTDVQNMFYSAKHQHNARLNFARLLEFIARGRPVVRALAYVVRSPEVDQSKFLSMLRGLGFEVKSKDLRVRADGSAKGDWDMGIALDALALAGHLDVVCLVSGDGDFAELVRVLQAQGVRVEVYSFRPSTAEELIQAADEFYEIGPELLIFPSENGEGAASG